MDDVIGEVAGRFQIAGFWRRLFAFCLDGLLLGALGGCMGLVAYDRLVGLGDWGRAVGFTIALVYFGAMDSAIFGGQSFGKRLLGIKVVTADGRPLSLGASTLRATIFCVPYFLNGAMVDAGAIFSWLSVLMTLIVFGLGASIVYLLIFNRRTRQSVHDLAVGAYVVSAKVGGAAAERERIWRAHFGVIGFILIAAAVLPYIAQRLANSAPFASLLVIQQGLQQQPDVRHATVNIGVNAFSSKSQGTTTTHVVSSRLFVVRRLTDFDSLADR